MLFRSVEAKKHLKLVLDRIDALQYELNWLLPGLSYTQGQSPSDKESYRVLVKFQDDLTKLTKAANDEASRILNIVRAGAGNRPDANEGGALTRTLTSGALGLSGPEGIFRTGFRANQGQTWKEDREALSAIWAQRGGVFANLTPGKGNRYNVDVEYSTTDVGKPQLWDQKTIFSDQTPFDGRIRHTHHKNTDENAHGVGLLFDSTFENETNYEKAWVNINRAILSGDITASAVREVRAPNPSLFQSEIYVEMASRVDPGTVAANIKWAEPKLNGAQQDGFDVIPAAQLGGTNYAAVLGGTAASHSRYTNNRNWLPPGVYDEYAASGPMPNEGAARFVATESRDRIYLTVTHYKRYTVKLANNTIVNRKAFFRVL